MRRLTLIAASSFLLGILLVVSTRTAQSAEEPKVAFPEEPRAIFENLVTSRLNVCDDANIVISYFEGPTGIDIPKHYHPGDEYVYMIEGSLIFWREGHADSLLQKGDLFKVPPMQNHTAILNREPVKCLIIDLYREGDPIHVNVDDEGNPIEDE